MIIYCFLSSSFGDFKPKRLAYRGEGENPPPRAPRAPRNPYLKPGEKGYEPPEGGDKGKEAERETRGRLAYARGEVVEGVRTRLSDQKDVFRQFAEELSGQEYGKGAHWANWNEEFAKRVDLGGDQKASSHEKVAALQRVVFTELGLLGKDPAAQVDGRLGPYTLAALARFAKVSSDKIKVPSGAKALEASVAQYEQEVEQAKQRGEQDPTRIAGVSMLGKKAVDEGGGVYSVTTGATKTYFRFQDGKWQWASESQKNANDGQGNWQTVGEDHYTLDGPDDPRRAVNELSDRLRRASDDPRIRALAASSGEARRAWRIKVPADAGPAEGEKVSPANPHGKPAPSGPWTPEALKRYYAAPPGYEPRTGPQLPKAWFDSWYKRWEANQKPAGQPANDDETWAEIARGAPVPPELNPYRKPPPAAGRSYTADALRKYYSSFFDGSVQRSISQPSGSPDVSWSSASPNLFAAWALSPSGGTGDFSFLTWGPAGDQPPASRIPWFTPQPGQTPWKPRGTGDRALDAVLASQLPPVAPPPAPAPAPVGAPQVDLTNFEVVYEGGKLVVKPRAATGAPKPFQLDQNLSGFPNVGFRPGSPWVIQLPDQGEKPAGES